MSQHRSYAQDQGPGPYGLSLGPRILINLIFFLGTSAMCTTILILIFGLQFFWYWAENIQESGGFSARPGRATSSWVGTGARDSESSVSSPLYHHWPLEKVGNFPVLPFSDLQSGSDKNRSVMRIK